MLKLFLSSCALQFKYFLKDPVKYDVKYQVHNECLTIVYKHYKMEDIHSYWK